MSARAGHSAATTWSTCARRSAGAPLTSSSRSGRNTDTSGRTGASAMRSTARAVDAHPLGLARLEADRQRVPAVRVVAVDLHARRARAEAHNLALVARPAGSAGATEVQGLEQVRLAGAVAAVSTVSPSPSATSAAA